MSKPLLLAAHVASAYGSVRFWWCCNMLCTSSCPLLVVLQYVMYFQFCVWLCFSIMDNMVAVRYPDSIVAMSYMS